MQVNGDKKKKIKTKKFLWEKEFEKGGQTKTRIRKVKTEFKYMHKIRKK